MTKAFLIFAAFLLAGCQTSSGPSAPKATAPLQAVEQPATHGMLMVGNGPVYLSHLPMFHSPHDYQLLLEVEMVKTGHDPLFTYVQDRQVTGEKIYTVVPEPFVLSELVLPAGAPARRSFKADVVRGHFERGGSEFISGVTFKVKRVVYSKKLEASAAPLPSLQYLVFGNEKELFAAHLITRQPDFDHVVSVRINEGIFNDAQAALVRKGAFLSMPAFTNDLEQALETGEIREAEVRAGPETLPVSLETLTDFYLEAGDLSH